MASSKLKRRKVAKVKAGKPQTWIRWLAKAWSMLGVVVLVVGTLPEIYYLYAARFTVEVSEPLNPHDIGSATISISDTGTFALKNMTIRIHVEHIDDGEGGQFRNADLYAEDYQELLLKADQKIQLPISDIDHIPVEDPVSGRIVVGITYRLSFVPSLFGHADKTFPFEVRKCSDGNFHWYAAPSRESRTKEQSAGC